MKIIKNIFEFIEYRNKLSKKIALVPTMGSIHEGHLSLVDTAKQYGEIIIATIFINPMQFNSSEDYKSYPKDFDQNKKFFKTKVLIFYFVLLFLKFILMDLTQLLRLIFFQNY